MPAGCRPSSRRWGLTVALFALAGAGLVLLSTAKYGAAVSPDSTVYLDVARSLVAGKGAVLHTGRPLVWFPPLYPLLLALVGSATRLDPAVFANLVNAVLFALVVWLSARLLRLRFRQTAYGVLGLCAVLLSIPFSDVFARVWSEPLFIPLLLLYLIFAERYWAGGRLRWLALMTLVAALACITRYSGIGLVLAGVLTILLAHRSSFKGRLARASVFAVLSLLPLGLWALRNHHLAGTYFGSRGRLESTFAANVILSARAIVGWYVPGQGTVYIKLMTFGATAAAIVALFLSRAVRRRTAQGLKAVLADCPTAWLLSAAYLLALCVAGMLDAKIDSRMLSPLYVPVTLILLALSWHLFNPGQGCAPSRFSRAPSVLLALWLCFPLATVAPYTARRFKNGAGGYNKKAWRESETIAYARETLSADADARVFSNAPDALWEFTRVDAVRIPDRRTGSLRDLEELGFAREGSVLVWFVRASWSRGFLFMVDELRRIADLEEVARFSDGAVYHVQPRPAPSQVPAP